MKKKSGRKKGHRSKVKKNRRSQQMTSDPGVAFSDEIALQKARAIIRAGSRKKAWDFLLRSLDKLGYDPGDIFHVKLMLRAGLIQEAAEWMQNPECRIEPADRDRLMADAIPLLQSDALDILDPSGRLREDLPLVLELLKPSTPDRDPEKQRRTNTIPIRSPYRHWRVFVHAQCAFTQGRYANAFSEFSKIPVWSLLFEPASIFLAAAGARIANHSGITRLNKLESTIASGAFGDGIWNLLIIEQTELLLNHSASDLALLHIDKLRTLPFIKDQMHRIVRLAFATHHIKKDEKSNTRRSRLQLRSAGPVMQAALLSMICDPEIISENPEAIELIKTKLLIDLGWMTDPRKKGHRATLQRMWVEALLTLLMDWNSFDDADMTEMLNYQLNLLDQWDPDDPVKGWLRLKFIKATNPAAASRQIDAMLKLDPGNVALMLEAADAAAKRRSFTIALKWIDQAIGIAPTDRKLQPKKVDILLKSSAKHLRAGMPEAAMKELVEAGLFAVTPDNRWHIVLAKYDTALFGRLTQAQSDQPDAVNSLFIEDLLDLAQAFECFSFVSSNSDIKPLVNSVIERSRQVPPLQPSDVIDRVSRYFELHIQKSRLLRDLLLIQIQSLSETDIKTGEDMNNVCSLFVQSRNPEYNDLYYRFISSGIERFHDNLFLYLKYLDICEKLQKEIPLRIIAKLKDCPQDIKNRYALNYLSAESIADDMRRHNRKLARLSGRKSAKANQDESGNCRQGRLFKDGSISDT